MLGRIRRLFRSPATRLAGRLAALADALRDAGHHHAAAILYDESLRIRPGRAPIHVQAGHMFKEAGDLARAEAHYLAARELAPDDADAALQLGHFYTLVGRAEEAGAAYARAAALQPGAAAPAVAGALAQTGDAEAAGAADDVIRELLPRQAVEAFAPMESIHIAQLGRIERTPSGDRRTLRGVEALRGFCISTSAVRAFQILCDGRPLHQQTLPEPEVVGPSERRKLVFNAWHDFSAWPEGRHEIEFRCDRADGTVQSRREQIVIAAPLDEARFPDSDGLVALDPDDRRTPEEQIDARPSMVRPATRALLARPPRAILVQRADQLGDLVVSVPAIRRLREIFGDARLVGLLTPANAALAATLGLFDEIVIAEFGEDAASGRRVMTAAAQVQLRRRLASHRFDLAIDLSENSDSRPLLRLSGAPLLYGVGGRTHSWMSAGLDGFTRDPIDGHERVPPSARIVGLVEWLGALLRSHAVTVPRGDLDRTRLGAYGLMPGDRYVLLHGGARLAFSRWPHFGALAALILERTDRTVVLMDGGAADLPDSDRLRRIDGQLPFDDFDALLSFCDVMVGNDSGPKHLAALRGAKVVSVHMARTNWNEWGQEGDGLIVSRRVPCAGCAIHHHPEECGKGFACIAHITAEEVFAAVAGLL